MRYQSKRTSALESGQGLVEYALALILVGVAVIVGLSFFGETLQKQYCTIITSIDPDIDAPLCDEGSVSEPANDPEPEDPDEEEEEEEEGEISVSCNIHSSPLRVTASVSDKAGVSNIKQVDFYVDGKLNNVEKAVLYCLDGGDISCNPFTDDKGPHTITAIAYDADGHSGSCTTSVTIY